MAANLAGYVATQPTPQTTESIQGRYVYDTTVPVVTDYTEVIIGFEPDSIVWKNLTDGSIYEWDRGMAQDSAYKTTAAGARTLLTAGGFTIPGNRTFRLSQNATTAAIAASKVCSYKAIAN